MTGCSSLGEMALIAEDLLDSRDLAVAGIPKVQSSCDRSSRDLADKMVFHQDDMNHLAKKSSEDMEANLEIVHQTRFDISSSQKNTSDNLTLQRLGKKPQLKVRSRMAKKRHIRQV